MIFMHVSGYLFDCIYASWISIYILKICSKTLILNTINMFIRYDIKTYWSDARKYVVYQPYDIKLVTTYIVIVMYYKK